MVARTYTSCRPIYPELTVPGWYDQTQYNAPAEPVTREAVSCLAHAFDVVPFLTSDARGQMEPPGSLDQEVPIRTEDIPSNTSTQDAQPVAESISTPHPSITTAPAVPDAQGTLDINPSTETSHAR